MTLFTCAISNLGAKLETSQLNPPHQILPSRNLYTLTSPEMVTIGSVMITRNNFSDVSISVWNGGKSQKERSLPEARLTYAPWGKNP